MYFIKATKRLSPQYNPWLKQTDKISHSFIKFKNIQ